jgi:PilZ domain-containing protein
MLNQALPIDWVFQPARWRPVQGVAEWLRLWAARRLERRQGPRQRVTNLAAHYWDGGAANSHIVKDVSTGGAFMLAEFKWPIGTVVTMTLQMQEPVRGNRCPTPVLVRTRIVRRTSDGLGVEFLCFSKAERRSLEDFLKSVPES